jgi:hypothetical protein
VVSGELHAYKVIKSHLLPDSRQKTQGPPEAIHCPLGGSFRVSHLCVYSKPRSSGYGLRRGAASPVRQAHLTAEVVAMLVVVMGGVLLVAGLVFVRGAFRI